MSEQFKIKPTLLSLAVLAISSALVAGKDMRTEEEWNDNFERIVTRLDNQELKPDETLEILNELKASYSVKPDDSEKQELTTKLVEFSTLGEGECDQIHQLLEPFQNYKLQLNIKEYLSAQIHRACGDKIRTEVHMAIRNFPADMKRGLEALHAKMNKNPKRDEWAVLTGILKYLATKEGGEIRLRTAAHDSRWFSELETLVEEHIRPMCEEVDKTLKSFRHHFSYGYASDTLWKDYEALRFDYRSDCESVSNALRMLRHKLLYG